MEGFKYTDGISGDQIRILTLQPSSHITARIECLLTTYSREQCGPYEALSYCWGAPSPTATINVNGLPLEIRNELASALYHIRSSDKPRYLWADAICINQASNPGKSVQVAQMDQTYSKSTRTLVWLGRASEDHRSALAMKSIEYISFQVQNPSLSEAYQCRLPLPRLINGVNPEEYLLAIQRLLERPWFGRLWVNLSLYTREGKADVV